MLRRLPEFEGATSGRLRPETGQKSSPFLDVPANSVPNVPLLYGPFGRRVPRKGRPFCHCLRPPRSCGACNVLPLAFYSFTVMMRTDCAHLLPFSRTARFQLPNMHTLPISPPQLKSLLAVVQASGTCSPLHTGAPESRRARFRSSARGIQKLLRSRATTEAAPRRMQRRKSWSAWGASSTRRVSPEPYALSLGVLNYIGFVARAHWLLLCHA